MAQDKPWRPGATWPTSWGKLSINRCTVIAETLATTTPAPGAKESSMAHGIFLWPSHVARWKNHGKNMEKTYYGGKTMEKATKIGWLWSKEKIKVGRAPLGKSCPIGPTETGYCNKQCISSWGKHNKNAIVSHHFPHRNDNRLGLNIHATFGSLGAGF